MTQEAKNKRLKDYEDTRLGPDEIQFLKERRTSMMVIAGDEADCFCPVCEWEVAEDRDCFCPRCGQALKYHDDQEFQKEMRGVTVNLNGQAYHFEDEEELLELLISGCDESESAKVAENIIVYDDENL